MHCAIDLVSFVQFKKREKHPWWSVTFNKATLLHGCFSRFQNCTNGTKICAKQLLQKSVVLDSNITKYNSSISGQRFISIPLQLSENQKEKE